MERKRRRAAREAQVDEDKNDLRRQVGISLWVMVWMIIVMVSFYLELGAVAFGSSAAILVVSTIGLYIKYRQFYDLRDRGQRTLCVTYAMYASLILTLICAYYYTQEEVLTPDYAAVFLFGWFFFTFTLYRTMARYMVVGNKRARFRA